MLQPPPFTSMTVNSKFEKDESISKLNMDSVEEILDMPIIGEVQMNLPWHIWIVRFKWTLQSGVRIGWSGVQNTWLQRAWIYRGKSKGFSSHYIDDLFWCLMVKNWEYNRGGVQYRHYPYYTVNLVPTCTKKYSFDKIAGANIGGWYFTTYL